MNSLQLVDFMGSAGGTQRLTEHDIRPSLEGWAELCPPDWALLDAMDTSSTIRIGPFEVFDPVQPAVSSVRHYGEHSFPGRLFVVEGIDGSGKSTQLSPLHKWLESKGYGVVFGNSSPLVKDTTKLGKKKKMLTPATFSLIHTTDFTDRAERSILPLLKAGAVVLCDRYIYTAFARDVAGGMTRMGARSRRGLP